MRIVIVGLGHLGAVTAGCLAKLGHEIVGIDRDLSKVHALERGQSPIDETGLQALIGEASRRGRIRGVAQLTASVSDRDLILLCVDTPAARHSLNLTNLLAVCAQLRELARTINGFPPVVIRSTLPPGAFDATLAPFSSGRGKLRLIYNPEFSREGSAVADFMDPGQIVIGVRDRRDALKVRQLYQGIDAPIHVTSWNNAEILKCAENSFHALKVTFANEIGSLCESFGGNPEQVMALLCADTRLNISPAYLRPGLPFGGPCLHKDLGALLGGAHHKGIEVPLLRAILHSNRQHLERIVRAIKRKHARVGFIGLSHKRGVSDTRGSHLITLAKRLKAEGIEVNTSQSRNGKAGQSSNHARVSFLGKSRPDIRRDSDVILGPGTFGSIQVYIDDENRRLVRGPNLNREPD